MPGGSAFCCPCTTTYRMRCAQGKHQQTQARGSAPAILACQRGRRAMPGGVLSAALALRLIECAAHKRSISTPRHGAQPPRAWLASGGITPCPGSTFCGPCTTTYRMRCAQEKHQHAQAWGSVPASDDVAQAGGLAPCPVCRSLSPCADALARGTGFSISKAKNGTRSPFLGLKSSISCQHFFSDIATRGGQRSSGRSPKRQGSRAMLNPHTHRWPPKCVGRGACMARLLLPPLGRVTPSPLKRVLRHCPSASRRHTPCLSRHTPSKKKFTSYFGLIFCIGLTKNEMDQ